MSTTQSTAAAAAGTFTLGGDLTVNRLGYGAMRITGKGIWGLRKTSLLHWPCCGARWSWA